MAFVTTCTAMILSLACLWAWKGESMAGEHQKQHVLLPAARLEGPRSLEETLQERRSVRSYQAEPLTLDELSQLLWAGQGITAGQRFRTAPSAGALYPLELYAVAGNVKGLAPGIYRYEPLEHRLVSHLEGDLRLALCDAALRQSPVRNAPLVLVITGVPERTASRYGERAGRYVYMEAGHAAQNISLQAVSLGLGTVMIGAFQDQHVRSVLQLSEKEQPLYLIPTGRK